MGVNGVEIRGVNRRGNEGPKGPDEKQSNQCAAKEEKPIGETGRGLMAESGFGHGRRRGLRLGKVGGNHGALKVVGLGN